MANSAGSANEPDREHLSRLAKLLPLWPGELADTSLEGRRKRIALIRRALRAERRRGLAGHWTYDLARHAGLLACYHAEVAALDRLKAGSRPAAYP